MHSTPHHSHVPVLPDAPLLPRSQPTHMVHFRWPNNSLVDEAQGDAVPRAIYGPLRSPVYTTR